MLLFVLGFVSACFCSSVFYSFLDPCFTRYCLCLFVLSLFRTIEWRMLYPHITLSVLSVLIGLLFGLSVIASWQNQHDAVLLSSHSFFVCGQPEQALRVKLPSQQWIFRLDSYRWHSINHRFDRVIVHAYRPMLFSEGTHYCLSVHSRRQDILKQHKGKLKKISLGILGSVQLDGVQSMHPLATHYVGQARHWVRSWINHFSSPQARHILRALLLGDRSSMNRNDWQLFSKTGTSHLVAVSGLHVVWMVLFFSGLLSRVFDLFPAMYRYCPRTILSSLLTLLLSLGYASFVYPSIPSARTLLLLGGRSCLAFFGDSISSLQLLLFVFLTTSVIYPFSYCQVSACLSYWAVFWLLSSPSYHSSESLSSWFLMQTWILLALFPLTVFYFGHWYAVSWFANVLAVPWVSLLLFPLCVMSLLLYGVWPWLSIKLLLFLQFPLNALLWCLNTLSKHPIVSVSLLHYGFFSLCLSVLLIWVFRYPRIRWHVIMLSLPLFLFLVFGGSFPFEHGIWVPSKRGGVFLYRYRHHSFLYAKGVTKSMYRFSLPRTIRRLHWGRIDHCLLSASGVAGLSTLCKSVQVQRRKSRKKDHDLFRSPEMRAFKQVSREQARPIRWLKFNQRFYSW